MAVPAVLAAVRVTVAVPGAVPTRVTVGPSAAVVSTAVLLLVAV